MFIDSHAHLNFSAFADNYREIIADCLQKQIGVLNVGSQFETSKRAVEIANEYPNEPIYASIGIHPIHLSHTEHNSEEIKFKSKEENFDEKKYTELINNKVVAVGEIGLDYFHQPEDKNSDWKELQKQGLIDQLKFAAKNKLPIILHARGSKQNPPDAYLDLLNILEDYKNLKGVIHCFGSTLDIAQKFLALGFYIGFTGIITFQNKSVKELQEVVKNISLDKILIETDSPYLTPEPHRGEKNKPQNVEFVARKVAELKNETFEKVCEVTTQNFKDLFL